MILAPAGDRPVHEKGPVDQRENREHDEELPFMLEVEQHDQDDKERGRVVRLERERPPVVGAEVVLRYDGNDNGNEGGNPCKDGGFFPLPLPPVNDEGDKDGDEVDQGRPQDVNHAHVCYDEEGHRYHGDDAEADKIHEAPLDLQNLKGRIIFIVLHYTHLPWLFIISIYL